MRYLRRCKEIHENFGPDFCFLPEVLDARKWTDFESKFALITSEVER